MPNAAPDPLVALCEEWLALDAALDGLSDEEFHSDLPIWRRYCEAQDALARAKPVTLAGLIAQQAVLRSIDPV